MGGVQKKPSLWGLGTINSQSTTIEVGVASKDPAVQARRCKQARALQVKHAWDNRVDVGSTLAISIKGVQPVKTH